MTTFYQICILLISLCLTSSNALSQNTDFGDAPDPPFPTLSASNGAQHLLTPFILGNHIDGELNGQPFIFAYGDDYTGIYDDEDGVIYTGGWLIPGLVCTVNIKSAAPAFLNAWVDFNNNGNWNDPGELIFNNQPVNPGLNTLSFNLPSGMATGVYIYARFRIASTPGMGYTGLAPDGEVEDYAIYTGQPLSSQDYITPDPFLNTCQNEISITKVPVSGNLITAFNNQPFPNGNGIGIAYSNNSGITWNNQSLLIPNHPLSGLSLIDAFDPSIASNDSGHAFVAYIATDYNWSAGPASGLFVQKSVNGGQTWLSPVCVDFRQNAVTSPDTAYRFNDRCQIRTDRFAASPYHNNIYISWIQDRGWNAPQPWGDIYFTKSSNGGKTFTAALKINETHHNMGNMPVIDVAPNGTIYVLWMDYNCQTGGVGVMYLDKSTNGGLSWGTDIYVDSVNLPPLNLNNTDVLAKGAAVIRVSPINSNHLYVAYAERPLPGLDESDIFFIRSTNAGVTWSTPIKVNNDVSACDQVLPWMEVKPDGTIEIVWYDRRNDPNDYLWDVYYAASSNGGQSFISNLKVNTVSFPTPQTKNGKWFGEYLALTSDNQKAYIAYTSSLTDPSGDILFASINNPFTSAENFKVPNFNIYPNPFVDIINITTDDYYNENGTELKIYSIYNQKVYQTTINQTRHNSLNLGFLATGIYIVELTKGVFKLQKKIVKLY